MQAPPVQSRVLMLFVEGWQAGTVVAHRTKIGGRERTLVEFQCHFDDGTLTWVDPKQARLRMSKGAGMGSATGAMEQDAQRISLRCCLSLAPLVDPARGEDCTHIARCNHTTLVECIARSRTCPVAGCDATIRTRSLVRDQSLREALGDFGQSSSSESPPPEFALWTARTRTLSADHSSATAVADDDGPSTRASTRRHGIAIHGARASAAVHNQAASGAAADIIEIDVSEEEWEWEEWAMESEEGVSGTYGAVHHVGAIEEGGGGEAAIWTSAEGADEQTEAAPTGADGSRDSTDFTPLPLRRPPRQRRAPSIYEAGPSDANQQRRDSLKRAALEEDVGDPASVDSAAGSLSCATALGNAAGGASCTNVHTVVLRFYVNGSPCRFVHRGAPPPANAPPIPRAEAREGREKVAIAAALERIIWRVERSHARQTLQAQAAARRLKKHQAEVAAVLEAVLGRVERAVDRENRRRWKRMRALVLPYIPGDLYGTPPVLARLLQEAECH